jgi:hypothetical protein
MGEQRNRPCCQKQYRSHTVTKVDGAATNHWLPYVTGCTIALIEHVAGEPFTRGAAYVW